MNESEMNDIHMKDKVKGDGGLCKNILSFL